ncbi:MAG TPA: histidine kinase, partial [Chitinophagaceae bacterium]|nr:histidine kinase [Chitinophagaceae bacterium]
NSLNNIYSLAYQKSDKTPEAILKLSEIMRYMLQESNEIKVELAQELRYLHNYIELQKLRFKGETFIDLRIQEDQTARQIAPLILIAFVENAFKHGTASDPENPIRISISVHKGKLLFSVFNKKSLQNKDEASGIGLNNVKRRLDLLYQGKYTLSIRDDEQTYFSELYLVLQDDTLPCC